MKLLSHKSKDGLKKQQHQRLEDLRLESLMDMGGNWLVFAFFGMIVITTCIGMALISVEVGSVEAYLPTIIFGLFGPISLLILLRDPRKNQRRAFTFINVASCVYYFVFAVIFGRVDLVIFWAMAHIIWTMHLGGRREGIVTLIYLFGLLYASLYHISPDIQINRSLNYALLNINPFFIVFGFIILSNLKIDTSFLKLMTERDAAKTTIQRMDLIMKHTGMGILDTTIDQTIKFSNTTAQSLLGHTKSIVGKSLHEIASFKDKEGNLIAIADNAMSNAVKNNEHLKDYQVVISESSVTVEIDVVNVEGGGSVIVLKPITIEQMEAEELKALRKRQEADIRIVDGQQRGVLV